MGSGFLSVNIGFTEVAVFLFAWYMLLRYWENSGKLDEWNASRIFFGMVLICLLYTSDAADERSV